MAVTTFVMPKLAMGMNEGTVQEWLVADGERVEKGQTIASVETEKVAYELEAPVAGLVRLIVAGGETVPVETPIALFGDSADELADAAVEGDRSVESSVEESPPAQEAAKASEPDQPGDRVKASPLARRMAADRGLDLSRIGGSGPGGRIVKRDILAAPALASVSIDAQDGLREQARIPLAGMRAAIASNMMQQLHSTATISLYHQADVSDLLLARRQLAEQADMLGTKVSVNAFFIKAIAAAARQYPILNASIEGEEIVVWDSVNVGFALALPSGDGYTENLMVPVVRNADRLSLREVDLEMKRLIALGQEGRLGPADMQDSTITFTTTAGIAPDGAWGNAIINGSNACIVGIGGAKSQPAEYAGEIVLRSIAPVIVNYDHRLVDGAPASRFLGYLDQCLNNPVMIMA